jgi:Na+/H+-dicarboxylate symporter
MEKNPEIPLIAGIDRILDMGRTTVNITGDSACAICVNKWENARENRKAAKAARQNIAQE